MNNERTLNRVTEERVKDYIREQLEDIIFILGLEVSACIDREWSIRLIKEQTKRL